LVAGIVASLSHPLIEHVSDLLIGLGRRVLIDHRGPHLTREGMASRINATQTGVAERLACDDERIRRWKTGEVRWPSPVYRRALSELTGLEPAELGFVPHDSHGQGRPGTLDTLRAEAEFFDTMELARMVTVSDVGEGTAEALQEAADLLCRAYPSAPAEELRQAAAEVPGPAPGRTAHLAAAPRSAGDHWLAVAAARLPALRPGRARAR
jgi:hypothetical protein